MLAAKRSIQCSTAVSRITSDIHSRTLGRNILAHKRVTSIRWPSDPRAIPASGSRKTTGASSTLLPARRWSSERTTKNIDCISTTLWAATCSSPRIRTGELTSLSNVRSDNNESFGTAVTYRIAPAFIVPGLDTKLKASYGTGFKAPTLEQLYVNFPPFFYANPGLQPEKSVGYDYGFEQPLFNDTFRMGMTYFHNDIKGLIQSCSLGVGFTTTLCNIGLATTYGNESFAAWKVNDRLTLRFDYTYTTARDDIAQLLLLRRPRNKETYQIIWKPIDQLTLSANILHEGTWADINRTGTVPNALEPIGPVGGPYTTVNLAANYTVSDRATVFGRVDNLFNADYQDPIGFLRPGRGIFGGLRFASF
jgi:vitamin B12 transporter